MLLRCLILLFCICAISGQKGGRRVASESSPVARAAALGRKTIPAASEKIQQVQEPERDPDEDREVVSAVRPTRPQPDDPQEGHAAPEPYNFKYSVDDPESGAQSSREETQDASGEIVGYYHIQDKDGRSRRVDYTAGKDGFKAKIKSNEEGLNSRSPADVDIELSASPSEKVESFAPNNRPQASESSIKSYGKPPQKKFFERLIPTTTRLPPPPPPPPQEQDSQAFESSNDSDPDPEITQQRNVDEDEPQAFESVKGLPPPRPTTYRPIPAVQTYRPLPTPRPVGTFNPVRNQVYAEQGLVSLQPILGQPQVQTREDIPSNSIQEVQQSLDVPQPPPPPPPSSDYNTPQSSVFIYPNRLVNFPRLPPAIPLAPPPVETIQSALQPPRRALSVESFSVPPQPRVEQQQIQYRSSVLQSPPPPAPQSGEQVSPPTNNVVFGPQHGQPLTHQQFLQFFQPTQDFSPNFGTTPGQPIVFDATPGRAINLFSAFNDNGQTLMSYVPPQTRGEPIQQTIEGPAGYRLVVQREQDTYQLPAQVMQNPQVIEQSPELYQINQQQVSQQLGQQQGPQLDQQQFLQQGPQQGQQQGLQQGQQQYLQQGPQQGLQQDLQQGQQLGLQQGQQQYLQQGPQQGLQQDLQQGQQQYLQQGPEQGLQQGQQQIPEHRTEVHQYQFQYQPLKPQFNIHSQQQYLTQEQASEEPLQEIIQDSRRLAPLTPPPPPPPAQPSIQQRLGPILPPPRPLPIPQPQPLRQEFDTQEYEPPTQQTYEPLQQSFEAKQESTPKCECQKAEQSVSYPIKGSQSAPAPVKGGRLSPAKRNINSFLPQAFRTRRESNAGTDSAKP